MLVQVQVCWYIKHRGSGDLHSVEVEIIYNPEIVNLKVQGPIEKKSDNNLKTHILVKPFQTRISFRFHSKLSRD